MGDTVAKQGVEAIQAQGPVDLAQLLDEILSVARKHDVKLFSVALPSGGVLDVELNPAMEPSAVFDEPPPKPKWET